MRAYLNTSITPWTMKVWDSSEPQGPGIVRRILQPQVILTDDEGKPSFVYGPSPPDYLPFIASGVIGVFILVKLLKRIKRK